MRMLWLIRTVMTSLSFLESCGSPGPKGTVEKFYKAVENGNTRDAPELVVTRSIQQFGRSKLE